MTELPTLPSASAATTSPPDLRHEGRTAHTAAKNRQMLWSLGFGGFLVNADNRAIAPMLPAIAVSLHVSAASAALLVTAYSIPYGLFQLLYGPVADRIGKIKTILIALTLFSIGTLVCGFVATFSWLLMLRVITGIFAAGIIPTTLAQIGDSYTIIERPRAIAFFMSLSTSGQALGIVIGGLVAQFFSYRVLFLVIGLAAVPAVLALLRQRDGQPAVVVSVVPLRDRYSLLLRTGRSRLIYSLILCEGFVFFGGFTFLGVYGVSTLHLSYLVIGLLTATYSLGAFVGSLTIAGVLRRIGSTRMPILGAAMMTVGFGLVWGWTNVVGLTVGFIVLGFGFSYCHSTLQTYATDLLPNARATAMSVFAFSLFLGSGLGPMAGGRVLDVFGVHAMLLAVTVGMAGFACLCTLLMRGKGNSDRASVAM